MRKMKTANDYAQNCLKPPKAFFEWCLENMPTYKWTNKNETILGSERKHCFTYEKRLAKNSRLTFFDRKDHFQIILSTSKRIEIQTYEVNSSFELGKQKFQVKLYNLEQLSNDKHVKIGYSYNKNYKFGLSALGYMYSYKYWQPAIYPNNWLNRLCTISELRFLSLNNLDVYKIAFVYKYRKRIEFAQRIGAPELAKDIINKCFDMRKLTPKWLKRHKVFFRNSERNISTLILKSELEKRGIKYILGVEKYLSYWDIDKFPDGIKPVTFQNYLIKQEAKIYFYFDYIKLMEELKRPLTSKNRFPKNLKEAHDEVVQTLNAMKSKEEMIKFSKRNKEIKFLEMIIDDIQFVLPKNAKEVIEEGKALKHCVGDIYYINGHLNGKFSLIFIRKKDEPTVPYFTLHYEKGEIKQNQGYKREKPNDELEIIVEKWLKIVNRKANREEEKHVA